MSMGRGMQSGDGQGMRKARRHSKSGVAMAAYAVERMGEQASALQVEGTVCVGAPRLGSSPCGPRVKCGSRVEGLTCDATAYPLSLLQEVLATDPDFWFVGFMGQGEQAVGCVGNHGVTVLYHVWTCMPFWQARSSFPSLAFGGRH